MQTSFAPKHAPWVKVAPVKRRRVLTRQATTLLFQAAARADQIGHSTDVVFHPGGFVFKGDPAIFSQDQVLGMNAWRRRVPPESPLELSVLRRNRWCRTVPRKRQEQPQSLVNVYALKRVRSSYTRNLSANKCSTSARNSSRACDRFFIQNLRGLLKPRDPPSSPQLSNPPSHLHGVNLHVVGWVT